MDQNKLLFDPSPLRVPSSVQKMISEPMVHLSQTMHQSCVKINSLKMNWNKLPLDPHHLGIPSGAPKMISKPIARLAQTVHQSCIKINTISKQTETSFHLTCVT
jgi:hypothetical protein